MDANPVGPHSTTAARLPLSRHSLRFRLTALYSVLFLVTSAGLLAIVYVLLDSSPTTLLARTKGGTVIAVNGSASGSSPHPARTDSGAPSPALRQLVRQLAAQADAQHARDLYELLTKSGIALAVMTVLAVALAWLTVGRALHPLRAMKTATLRITERNLNERLALRGPDDEVKDLADTIDGLLARLETAFEAQRRFVASASHELRTPLTLNRALLEVALADPAASADDLRATCEELLAAGEHQERLVEGLLTLATSERGLDRWESFDLADVTRRAIAAHSAAAEGRGLRLAVCLGHGIVRGDPDLTERMAANLIDNAVRYNVPGGHLIVQTEVSDDHAMLTVENTGPPVPAGKVGQLFQPFQRLTDRTSQPDGHGLGLSIVRAIAAAHSARLSVHLRPGGGLTVRVRFPPTDHPSDGERPGRTL